MLSETLQFHKNPDTVLVVIRFVLCFIPVGVLDVVFGRFAFNVIMDIGALAVNCCDTSQRVNTKTLAMFKCILALFILLLNNWLCLWNKVSSGSCSCKRDNGCCRPIQTIC
jgi:hypothetical protein